MSVSREGIPQMRRGSYQESFPPGAHTAGHRLEPPRQNAVFEWDGLGEGSPLNALVLYHIGLYRSAPHFELGRVLGASSSPVSYVC